MKTSIKAKIKIWNSTYVGLI